MIFYYMFMTVIIVMLHTSNRGNMRIVSKTIAMLTFSVLLAQVYINIKMYMIHYLCVH